MAPVLLWCELIQGAAFLENKFVHGLLYLDQAFRKSQWRKGGSAEVSALQSEQTLEISGIWIALHAAPNCLTCIMSFYIYRILWSTWLLMVNINFITFYKTENLVITLGFQFQLLEFMAEEFWEPKLNIICLYSYLCYTYT